MKEIPISKRAMLIAVFAGVVIALGILAIQFLPLHPESDPSAPTQEDTLASKAAVSALEAFFHVDYKEGKESWLNRICTVSTLSGCQFISRRSRPLVDQIPGSKSQSLCVRHVSGKDRRNSHRTDLENGNHPLKPFARQ